MDCTQLVKQGQLKKAKVGDLKNYLKGFKQPQAGEKEDLMLRVELHVKSRDVKIDGKDPFELKAAELRKACAQRGVNPMQERDQMLKDLLETEKNNSGGGAGDDAGGGGGGDGDDKEGVTLAKKVLELDDDYCSILSLLGENITVTSPANVVRKQYLLLSRLIHPDKLPGFGQATKAFQLLVSALDGLTRPDLRNVDTSKAKTKTIVRSNDGCHRTAVHCPRCHAPWGESIDGGEKAAYTHLMTGIKTYICSTCLCDFGCVSAEHKCPHCRKPFEYSPDDFHNKITCGNKNCNRPFGFWLFQVSESRLKELREELKAVQEKRLKRQEALDRRNARAKNKGIGLEVGADAKLEEDIEAFKRGLLDACPKCGWEMRKRDGADEAVEHLGGCNNKKKIEAYQRQRRISKEVQAQKTKRREQQDELVNLKTWEFLGSDNESLWMLSLEQLRLQCAQYKLDDTGEKDDLIVRLVRHRNSLDSSRLLTDEAGKGEGRKAKASLPTRHTLPSNLESLSLAQLKAVAASHGIEAKGNTRQSVLDAIERERFRDEPQLRLTMTAEHEADDKIARKRKAPRGKGSQLDDSDPDEPLVGKPSKARRTAGDEDDDDDDDVDFKPDE